MTQIRKAVLLAAGRGTRMRELTSDLPKPMLRVREKPILQHIIEGMKSAGIHEFLIIIGWRVHPKEYRTRKTEALHVGAIGHEIAASHQHQGRRSHHRAHSADPLGRDPTLRTDRENSGTCFHDLIYRKIKKYVSCGEK